jgi:hypothetical protein
MHSRLISALALSALLSACSEGEDEEPMPGTPEAVLESHASAWKTHAKRAFVFEAREESPNDTTTYSCESRDGVVGRCIKVSRCCGDDRQVDTVDSYMSPTELLVRLRTDLGKSGYHDAESGPTGFTVRKRAADGREISSALSAAFHPDFGYPKNVAWFGASVASSSVAITRLEFR